MYKTHHSFIICVKSLPACNILAIQENYQQFPQRQVLSFHIKISYNISWIIKLNSLYFLAGECISGALYWRELFTLAAEIGFSRPFLVSAAPVPIDREDFKKILGKIFTCTENNISCKKIMVHGLHIYGVTYFLGLILSFLKIHMHAY